jgi:hypothetical protein
MLCNKLESFGFDSLCSLDFFIDLPNPSSHNMALTFTQPLTEVSTRNIFGRQSAYAHRADNLTIISEQIV